jgi:hypothetical protein
MRDIKVRFLFKDSKRINRRRSARDEKFRIGRNDPYSTHQINRNGVDYRCPEFWFTSTGGGAVDEFVDAMCARSAATSVRRPAISSCIERTYAQSLSI